MERSQSDNADRADIAGLRDAIRSVAQTQQHSLDLHTRTYDELQRVAVTLGHVHAQVLATNGRVTTHDTDISRLNAQVSQLQESAQWRAGALAAPRAVLTILKQQRALQAIVALIVLVGGAMSLPSWVIEAINTVITAVAATPTP